MSQLPAPLLVSLYIVWSPIMAQLVPFHITAGLPFERTITVTLPNGRTWWTLESQFEVLGQIRSGPNVSANLLLDLHNSLTATFDGVDEVVVELVLPGSETRKITQAGHYDIIISDTFTDDERAFVLTQGPVHWQPLVTASTYSVL